MMKRVIFILTVVLLCTTSIEAQNRKRAPKRKVNRVERSEIRAQRMTDAMVSTYNLNESQKEQLNNLNLQWLKKNQATRFENNRQGYRKQNTQQACFAIDSVCLATPTLYREIRLKSLTESIKEYRVELKKIMTSKQYKEYEKRLDEAMAKIK